MTGNAEFNRFIESQLNGADYIFIDPPWNYPPTKYKSTFWDNITCIDIFQNMKSPLLFIYTTLDKLPQLMCAHIESSYELRALIPYISVATHEDSMYALKNSFRNPLQYIAVFQSGKSKWFPDLPKSVAMEYVNDYHRPIMWEDKLFAELMHEGLAGVYLLPTGQAGDTTPLELLGVKMSKKELF